MPTGMTIGRAIPLRLTLVLLAGGVGLAGPQQASTAQNSANPQNNSAAPSQTPVLQNATIQPIALTPSQMPPSPPRITYAGGKLTVVANNAMLDDVLAGISKAIGADVQGIQPQGAERVFGQFGPAVPSQVIDTLLTGSQYDFVLVGSAGNFGSVREIILSRKSTATDQSGQSSQYVPVQQAAPAYHANESAPLVNDSTPLVDNQQQPPELSPEERAGFRRNRRGPGAREIVRPPAQQPNAPGAPPPTNNPN